MSLNGFEHKLLNFIRDEYRSFKEEKITVAVSGGADSVALLRALCKISPLLKCNVEALHIHHGDLEGFSSKQSHYRNEALSFCKKLSETLGVSFEFYKSKKPLTKEEECRDFRLEAFKACGEVFLAHHKNDFLETMLLRLIRGTGAQGLVDPFSGKGLYRPFLHIFTKDEILSYLQDENQVYLEDPSNIEEDALRNWVRNKWLKDLEKECGINSLSNSLNLISQSFKSFIEPEDSAVFFKENDCSKGRVEVSLWLSFNRFQKQSTVAHILLKTLKKGYTKGHIDEVVKNLESSKKKNQFEVCGLNWTKDEDSIAFSKL